MKFNPCILQLVKHFSLSILLNFIKLILKESFAFSRKGALKFRSFFITSKFLGPLQILFSVFSLSSYANFRLDFYSLWFDPISKPRKSQVRDQVISSSLISDPPVLAPISGASLWFSQSHLLLKFCGVWCVVSCYSLFLLWFSD